MPRSYYPLIVSGESGERKKREREREGGMKILYARYILFSFSIVEQKSKLVKIDLLNTNLEILLVSFGLGVLLFNWVLVYKSKYRDFWSKKLSILFRFKIKGEKKESKLRFLF